MIMARMTEAAILLEQARVLRAVAPACDHSLATQDVLRLAEKCERLAQAAIESAQKRARDPGDHR